MNEKILSAIKSNGLLENCTGIVLAVSGGPDSMALLRFFINYIKQPFICATVDHCLRPESKSEAEMVEKYCRENSVPFETVSVDITEYCPKGISSETFSRDIRYAFFDGLRRKYCFSHIATAHNSDDNCETILMNIIRGSGTHGLGGIPVLRDDLVMRPLLGCKKTEILYYCRENSIPYAIDKTNSENIYRRNIIRNRIFPLLAEMNPDVNISFENLSACARTDNEFLDALASDILKKASSGCKNGEYLLKHLKNTHKAVLSRAVRKAACDAGGRVLTFDKTNELVSLILNGKTSDRVDFYDCFAEIRYEKIIFCKNGLSENEIGGIASFRPVPGENFISEYGDVLKLISSDSYDGSERDCIIYTDYHLLKVRSRKEGDYFHLAGKPGGKLIKKLFTDKKIERTERPRIPVLVVSDGKSEDIVWVGGLGPSKDFLPEKGGKYIKLKWVKKTDDNKT